MKKFILLVITSSFMLAGCGPQPEHVKDTVREVEVGDTIISDGSTDITYAPNVDMSSLDTDEPELYVKLKDVETGSEFKVDLGSECSQYPLPKGQRFLTKFDMQAYKTKPNELYMTPYGGPVGKYLCPTS